MCIQVSNQIECVESEYMIIAIAVSARKSLLFLIHACIMIAFKVFIGDWHM